MLHNTLEVVIAALELCQVLNKLVYFDFQVIVPPPLTLTSG